MTVSTERFSAAATPAEAEKDRPARELALAVLFALPARLVVRALLPLRTPPPAVVLANAAAGFLAAVLLALGELVLASFALLPLLQLRRELRARSVIAP